MIFDMEGKLPRTKLSLKKRNDADTTIRKENMIINQDRTETEIKIKNRVCLKEDKITAKVAPKSSSYFDVEDENFREVRKIMLKFLEPAENVKNLKDFPPWDKSFIIDPKEEKNVPDDRNETEVKSVDKINIHELPPFPSQCRKCWKYSRASERRWEHLYDDIIERELNVDKVDTKRNDQSKDVSCKGEKYSVPSNLMQVKASNSGMSKVTDSQGKKDRINFQLSRENEVSGDGKSECDYKKPRKLFKRDNSGASSNDNIPYPEETNEQLKNFIEEPVFKRKKAKKLETKNSNFSGNKMTNISALADGDDSTQSSQNVIVAEQQIRCCPLCQCKFGPNETQMDIDGHIAVCFSNADDDVTW